MASIGAEEGEVYSDTDNYSDGTNLSPTRPCEEKTSEVGPSLPTSGLNKKTKKKTSRYNELSKRFTALENMLKNVLEKNSQPVQGQTRGPGTKNQKGILSDSEDETDRVSLFACGQISPSRTDKVTEPCLDPELDSNNNLQESESTLTVEQRKCLFDMFGEDAVVKKVDKREGLVLDNSQIEVLKNSYRCKEPNYLSAFSEESYDQFPVDPESENLLQVPSLDTIVESCLTKRYGNRASFVKNKGKHLYGQPAKMVEKIAYKGQQAAKLGLVIQMYVQQSLGNLLQYIDSDDFDKAKATQQVKDIFAMSTKCLDQIGRAGAFHHITRRSVAMTDTLLFEQPDNVEFSNLPLSGDGVFGPELESLLKARKEKKKQIDDLIPDVRKRDLKRKQPSYSSESNYKKPALENQGSSTQSSSGWNNFRIPKLPRDNRNSYRSRGSYNNYSRRSSSNRTSGPKSAKADDQ